MLLGHQGKSHVKYQVVGDGNSFCNDMGVKFSMNFRHREIYWEISCTFIGTGIGMPMYPGIKFFMKFGHLKFGCSKISQEMLDQ